MSIEGVNRYGDLIKSIVSGSFYDSKGIVLPFRSGKTELRLETGVPNRNYGLYLNEIYSGTVQSKSNGNVEFERFLPIGDIEVVIIDELTGKTHKSWVTVRSYASCYHRMPLF